MSTAHHHHEGHPVNDEHRRRFRIVLAITCTFFVIEAAGGWLTGSLALLADASHLLGDIGALSLALVAMWLVGRPATQAKTYGYHRAEILAALFNSLSLWLIAGLIWHEAYQRLFAQPEIQSVGMTVIAALGLIANLVSYFFLSSMPQQTLNTRTAMLHLIGDTLGSVGALAAGLIIWSTGWTAADPLVSFLIGGLILATSWGVMRESIDVLMEGTPKDVDLNAIITALGAVPGLEEVHDLHVWCLRSGVHALTLHGVIGSDVDDAPILKEMTRLLGDRFNLHHTTIQLARRPGLVQINTVSASRKP